MVSRNGATKSTLDCSLTLARQLAVSAINKCYNQFHSQPVAGTTELKNRNTKSPDLLLAMNSIKKKSKLAIYSNFLLCIGVKAPLQIFSQMQVKCRPIPINNDSISEPKTQYLYQWLIHPKSIFKPLLLMGAFQTIQSMTLKTNIPN